MERVRLSRRLCALVALGLVAAVIAGLGVYPLVRESIEIGRLDDPGGAESCLALGPRS